MRSLSFGIATFCFIASLFLYLGKHRTRLSPLPPIPCSQPVAVLLDSAPTEPPPAPEPQQPAVETAPSEASPCTPEEEPPPDEAPEPPPTSPPRSDTKGPERLP